MKSLSLVAVMAAVLFAAVGAIRRDPRITAREILIQILLMGAYAAVAAGIGWLTLANWDDRRWLIAGGVTFIAWLAVALPMLARYLGRRLRGHGR